MAVAISWATFFCSHAPQSLRQKVGMFGGEPSWNIQYLYMSIRPPRFWTYLCIPRISRDAAPYFYSVAGFVAHTEPPDLQSDSGAENR